MEGIERRGRVIDRERRMMGKGKRKRGRKAGRKRRKGDRDMRKEKKIERNHNQQPQRTHNWEHGCRIQVTPNEQMTRNPLKMPAILCA